MKYTKMPILNKMIFIRIFKTFSLIFLMSSAFADDIKKEQNLQRLRVGFLDAYESELSEDEVVYLLKRIHECLYKDLELKIVLCENSKESDNLNKKKEFVSDTSKLSIHFDEEIFDSIIHFYSNDVSNPDYHDFFTIFSIIREYAKTLSHPGIIPTDLNYVTSDIMLKRLHALIVNDLEMEDVLKHLGNDTGLYWISHDVHNFGKIRQAIHNGCFFPDFKVFKVYECEKKDYFMIFGGYASERKTLAIFPSFRRMMTIEESRRQWAEAAKKPEDDTKICDIVPCLYVPGCHVNEYDLDVRYWVNDTFDCIHGWFTPPKIEHIKRRELTPEDFNIPEI